jgi:hypothetical protein
MSTVVGPKDPEETKVVRFSFASELETGATLASAQMSITAVSGIDYTPAALLLGGPVIVGSDVLQRVQGGLDGVTYQLRVKANDNTGLVHVVSAQLLVAWA